MTSSYISTHRKMCILSFRLAPCAALAVLMLNGASVQTAALFSGASSPVAATKAVIRPDAFGYKAT